MSKAISRRDFIKVTGAVGAVSASPRDTAMVHSCSLFSAAATAARLPAPLLLLPRQLLLLRPSAA